MRNSSYDCVGAGKSAGRATAQFDYEAEDAALAQFKATA